jgi:hypothetical protein
MSEDFSKGKRGPVVKPDPNKVRITIPLDADIIEHCKSIVHDAGGGNYQTLINDALRGHIRANDKELVKALRKVIREMERYCQHLRTCRPQIN